MGKVTYPPDNYYEYLDGPGGPPNGMIVCGECVTKDLAATKAGDLVDEERVYSGMFRRLKDDKVEAYQCDGCLKQNEPYENMEVEW